MFIKRGLLSLSSTILIAIVVLAAAASAQSPVGWWKFDELSGTTAADASGRGHAALLVNGVARVKGKTGSAVAAASGSRQYLAIPAIDLSGTGTVTVALWANRTYSKLGGHALFEATTDFNRSATGFGFFPDDASCNGIYIGLRGNVGYSGNCYDQPTSGIWHHLVTVFDKRQTGGNQVSFYIDGELQPVSRSVSAVTNTNNFGNSPIYLFSSGGTTPSASGAIDDLRIYDTALTAEQIRQLHEPERTGGSNSHSIILSWTPSASPVAGYNAYQALTPNGPYVKLNAGLISSSTYSDWTVESGHTYFYVTTAVDPQGVESSFSEQAVATVP